MYTLGLIVGTAWIVCGVISYLVLRRSGRKITGQWTHGDRAMCLLISLFGPVGLISSLLMMIVLNYIMTWDDKASW